MLCFHGRHVPTASVAAHKTQLKSFQKDQTTLNKNAQEIKTTPFMFFWNGGSEEKVEFKDIQVNHFFTESYL